MRPTNLALALGASVLAAAAAAPADHLLAGGVDVIPTDTGRVIHRRGKFKQNARRQKGRKTLPRRA